MKTILSKSWITVLNTAVMNAISGVYSEITLADGEKEKRYRLSPYGVFPGKDLAGNDAMQVVDREAGEAMAANYGGLRQQVATFFRGIPIYEGHPDDAGWLAKNPGHRASAVGRIKSIECEDDGIYVTAVLNSVGVNLLSGEAPKYSGHSPMWRMVPVEGKANHFRPVLLWSDALTNTPNIQENTIALNASGAAMAETFPQESPNQKNETEMKLTPEALAALGLADGATPEEISAAIMKMVPEKPPEKKPEMMPELVAANSRATALETELAGIRGAAITTVINDAVTTGRITEADRPAWTTALNTSFISEANKLASLMPILNVKSQLPGGLAGQKPSGIMPGGMDAINAAVRETATAQGLDLANRAGYDEAHRLTRKHKPELYVVV
jgi:Mu-like prophage I protein